MGDAKIIVQVPADLRLTDDERDRLKRDLADPDCPVILPSGCTIATIRVGPSPDLRTPDDIRPDFARLHTKAEISTPT